MILKGSQRSGAAQLARHLTRIDENEHVEIHEIRGFIADDLLGALREAEAASRGTRCKQFMFSLSLNPPEDKDVSEQVFEQALGRIEDRLGLTDQPRVLVFHEKNGRRHAHCVWSRIDTAEMKAINLPHYKTRLSEIGKQIHLEQGWDLPKGFIDKKYSDPLNFTREEWQQACRAGKDPKMIKAVLQQCWQIADSKAAFAEALKDHGYRLAKGDRRGFVAVDWQGEPYALSRALNMKPKALKDRLGKPEELPSVAETINTIRHDLTPALKRHIDTLAAEHFKELSPLINQAQAMASQHRTERATQRMIQQQRHLDETAKRAARLRGGLKGVWDKITGRYWQTRKKNELEAKASEQRDREQREHLRKRQLDTRRELQQGVKAHKIRQQKEALALTRDIAATLQRDDPEPYAQQYRQTLSRLRKKKLQDKQIQRNKPKGFEPDR